MAKIKYWDAQSQSYKQSQGVSSLNGMVGDVSLGYGLGSNNGYISVIPEILKNGFNQLVYNGNFASTDGWTGIRCSVSASGNVMSATSTDASGTLGIYNQTNKIDVVSGHKYLYSAYVKAPHSGTVRVGAEGIDVGYTDIPANTWFLVGQIATSDTTSNVSPICYYTPNLAVGEVFNVKDFMIIDLTLLFGAGNEPTTVSQVRNIFPNEYYAYNKGNIIFKDFSVTTSSNSSSKLGYYGSFNYLQSGYIPISMFIVGASTFQGYVTFGSPFAYVWCASASTYTVRVAYIKS